MPLFGKSRFQKALEQKEKVIGLIVRRKGPDLLQKDKYQALLSEITKEVAGCSVLLGSTGDDAKMMVDLPTSTGIISHVYLYSLFLAGQHFAKDQKTGVRDVPFWAAFELCKNSLKEGEEAAKKEEYERAHEEYSFALKMARYTNNPLHLPLSLINLGVMELHLGRKDDAHMKWYEAISVMDTAIAQKRGTVSDFEDLKAMCQNYLAKTS